MKVICIDNCNLKGKVIKEITPGKIYDVISFITSPAPLLNHDMSQIIDDNGEKRWFSEEFLIPLKKWRELQLKELGI